MLLDTLTGHAVFEVLDGQVNGENHYVGRAIVTGVGVLDYQHLFGLNMFRPEEEVFDQASLETAKLLPITLGHPDRNLDDETTRQHAIGWTGEQVERRGNHLVINFKIVDGKIVNQILRRKAQGKRIQFSMGYGILGDRSPGVYEGQAYDLIQRRIRYNHLALLLDEDGRYPYTQEITDSQEEWLLLMDSAPLTPENPQEERPTVKIKLPNGAEIEVSDADGRYLENHIAEHENLKTQLATKAGELTQAQKQLNDAKGQIMDSATQQKAVAEQTALVLQAVQLLDSANPEDLANKTVQEIHEAVALADGYTAEELAEMKTDLKDSYGPTLAGIYSQIVRAKGEQVSETVTDSASKASANTRQQNGQVIQDALAPAQKKLQEKMDNARKGKNHAN